MHCIYFFPFLDSDFTLSESECIVQHLLCTRQLSNADPLPVVGLGTYPIPHSQPKIMVFLASGALHTLPVTAIHSPTIPGHDLPVTTPSASPLRKVR